MGISTPSEPCGYASRQEGGGRGTVDDEKEFTVFELRV